MQTFKRPAAMIAAAVVALAMVSPTAALATDGDRGKNPGHEARGERGNKAEHDHEAKADRGNDHEAKQDKKAEHESEAKAAHADKTKGDRAKADRRTRDNGEHPAEADRDDTRRDAKRRDVKATAGDSSPKTITAKALSDHSCDGNEWHFVITRTADDSAPSSITVAWANGDSETVSLHRVTGKVAHYATTSNLDSTVTSATATITGSWSGQFNLSHGPCGENGVVGGDDEVRGDDRDRDEDKDRDEDTGGDDVAGDLNDRDRGPWNVKAPLCHATSSATNPYVMITVSHKSIVKDAGHGAHEDDIIPPFAYQPHRGAESAVYEGLNWDTEGQELFANGCMTATGDAVAGVGGGTDQATDDTDGTGDSENTGGTANGTDTTDAPTVNGSDSTDTPTDVAVGDDEVLGVVFDNDDESAEDDAEVVAIAEEVDEDTATAVEAGEVADTEVQAAQSSDEEPSPGVLAMTGGSLLVLLIAGLASLFAGTGLLRRRS